MAKTILGPAPKKTILGPVEGFTGARRGPPIHKTLDNPEFQIPENDPWSRQKDMFSRVPEMETGTIAPTTIYRGQGDYPVQPSIGPMPEQNFWQKAKGFFVGQPDYGRWTKPTQLDYLHRTLDIPLNILTKFSSGRTFGADKLSWYVLSKIRPDLANKPLEEQMAALDPYEHSTFNKMTGEMAEFIGQIQSSQKLLSAIGINTPQGQKTIEKIVDKAPAWMMSGAIDAVVDGVVEEKEAKDVWKDVIVKSQTRAGEAVVWGGLEWGAGKIVQEIGKKFPRFSRAMQARLIKDPDKRQVRMDAIKAREHYRKYGTMPDDLMNKYVKPGLRGTDTDFTTQAANAAVEGEIVGIQALARQTPNMPVKQREAVLNHIKNLQKKIVSIEKQPQPTKVQEVTTKIPDTQIAQKPRTTPPAGESEQTGGVPQAQAEPEAGKSIAEIQDQQMQSVAKGTKPAYLADRSSFDKEEYPAQLEKMKQFAKENDLVYGEKRDGQGDMNGVVAKDQETLNDVLSAKTGQELKSTLDYKQIENLSKKVEDEGFMALSDEEFNQFLDQQSTPLETGKPPIEETQEGFPPEARNKGALDLGPLVDAAHTAHDWLFAFGEAKRSHPELYKALMSSYGKRNAGVERAVDEVQKILGERKLSTDEASAISLAYENKTLQPPKGLKDVSDKFLTLLGRLEQVQLKEGIFQRPFQERMIEENEQVIDRLKTELKHPDKSKRIQALVDENTKLRNMRYLPHSIVAQRVLEAKLNTLSGEKRKIFLDTWTRLSAQFKMRKGRGFLQEYMDAGLLSSEDVDIRRLSAQALSDYYYRSSMKDFFTFAKADGLIQPSSDQLRQEGWYNQRELGLTIPEAKGKMFHPLMATALNEMKEIRKGYPKNILRQMLAITKVGQFIKPTIVPTYDIIQKYMRGMWSLNPISEVRAMTEATRSVLTKDALYHKLNKDNLYQFPYEISKAGRDEQIQMMVDKTSLDVNILKNLWQSATGETWTAKDLFNARKMLMAGYRAIGNTTWTMDKIQRTQGYLVLRKLGLEHNEAVDTAAQGFGGYSLTSSKYKNQMSKVFFVHTFRFLMPREMAKTMTEPIVGAAKVAFGGDKIPKARWNRWAKALVGTAAIPVLTDQYMQYRGFEKDRKHIGPLAWKWKKDVPAYNADGTMKLKADGSPVTQELVVGINTILNMPVKYWNRATYYDPVSPSNRFVQAFKNLAKWEVHPLYRVMIWDIAQNRKSFGSGVQVYDPNETPIKQAGDILKYTFGQMFRLYGTMMDAAEAGNITEKEAKEQEHVYKNHLTSIDRILLKAIGYRYIRQDLNDRRKIKALSLNKEYNSRLYNIARKYSGEEAQRKKKNLDLWYKKTKTWIIDTMD